MGAFADGFRRLTMFIMYFIALGCSVVTLGIYAYFAASQANHNDTVSKGEKAVLGISGAGILFTLIASFLTLFFGNKGRFLNFICAAFDLLFVGGFIAVAILARHGASRCRGNVNTPLGTGEASNLINNYNIRYRTACKDNTAVFAVAIIAIFTFFLLFIGEILLRAFHDRHETSHLRSEEPVNVNAPVVRRKFWQVGPMNRNKGVTYENHGLVHQQPASYATQQPGSYVSQHV